MVSPLDLTGPQFLTLYAALLLGALLAAALLRRWLLRPDDEGPPPARDLDAYAMAMLGGREDRAADAVLASLSERGLITLGGEDHKVTQRTPAEGLPWLHPFERAVRDDIPPEGIPLPALHAQARQEAAAAYTERLREHGLLCTARQESRARFIPAFLFAMVGFFCLEKLSRGMREHRPIAHLLFLLILTGLCSIFFGRRPSWRTLRGTRVLQALRREHVALQTSACTPDSQLLGPELVMALGLFGLEAVNLPGVMALRAELKEAVEGQNTSHSASGCGGGGADGGGGDGGGGDGGGGGCGGCGGCGGGCGG